MKLPDTQEGIDYLLYTYIHAVKCREVMEMLSPKEKKSPFINQVDFHKMLQAQIDQVTKQMFLRRESRNKGRTQSLGEKPMKKVRVVSREGYANMKQGDIVDLIRIEPPYQDPTSSSGFTWPEYWVVQRPDGRECIGHAHRFEYVDELNQ